MRARFIRSGAELRSWLEENHDRASELLIGFHKVGSGRKGITYAEALDQALCFGWIDGVRKSLDEGSYTIRFTPRRKASVWSAVNVKRIGELRRQGLVHPAGLAAFDRWDGAKDGHRYSYEQRLRKLGPDYEKRFRAHRRAWEFFRAQAPSYQRTATWWVMNAKKEETRLRRLGVLIEDSKKGRRTDMLAPARSKRSG